MWRLTERNDDRRTRTWEISWSGQPGISGEDLLDRIEEALAVEAVDGAVRVRRASGDSPVLDEASSACVRVDEIADWARTAMTAIAGSSAERLILCVALDEAKVRRSA
jgi:hypothetical protein